MQITKKDFTNLTEVLICVWMHSFCRQWPCDLLVSFCSSMMMLKMYEDFGLFQVWTELEKQAYSFGKPVYCQHVAWSLDDSPYPADHSHYHKQAGHWAWKRLWPCLLHHLWVHCLWPDGGLNQIVKEMLLLRSPAQTGWRGWGSHPPPPTPPLQLALLVALYNTQNH